MREHMTPVNETVAELSLRVELASMSFLKFQIYASLDEAFSKQSESMGGGAELDEIKHMCVCRRRRQ
jgi:hypothetical protein